MNSNITLENRLVNALNNVESKDNEQLKIDNIYLNNYGVYYCEEASKSCKLRYNYFFSEGQISNDSIDSHDFIQPSKDVNENHEGLYIRLKIAQNEGFFSLNIYKEMKSLKDYAQRTLPKEFLQNDIEIFFEEKDGKTKMYYCFLIISKETDLSYKRVFSSSLNIAKDNLFLSGIMKYAEKEYQPPFTLEDLKKDFETCMENLKLMNY